MNGLYRFTLHCIAAPDDPHELFTTVCGEVTKA